MQYTANTLDNQWMPFTANRDFKSDPRLVVKGEGINYTNHNGDNIIDGSSGLFCCAAGHGRKEIAAAVAEQLLELDYSPHFQIGSPPSFELASRLSALTPENMNNVFFTNSGSGSIDSALKITMAYHHARGEGSRTRFVSRERAYHGSNIGGTSLSGLMKNRQTFGSLMPGVVHMRHTWLPEVRFVRGQPPLGSELAEDLQRFCELLGGSNIAACFVEPIAGSTGCLVPPIGYLERLREICDAHGILLVFDEVITGFGRTGKPFASQTFGVTPDMMTIAKGLTNGVLPMGAVVVKDEIYNTINEVAPDGVIDFFHGYTYSGNPASCAASLATLDIYEKENLFQRGADLSEYFLDRIFDLEGIDAITDIRGYGLFAAVDLIVEGAPGIAGTKALKALFAAGLHIKFTGDTALIAPPLIAKRKDIDNIVSILREVLNN
ncbi:MAG: aspartate aminotransferase family protein [Magnetovibrio sp.]|nr:aspartate aminotransferase family protein [Magnetovibrio sp.]|tara:strand:- start:403 stop:1710 length:1308 start_codon:yes stop_codon:yes gene_type:complete